MCGGALKQEPRLCVGVLMSGKAILYAFVLLRGVSPYICVCILKCVCACVCVCILAFLYAPSHL